MTTLYEIRTAQRLRSDQERQAHDAIVRADKTALDRTTRVRRLVWWTVVIVVALVLTGLAVVLGSWESR